MSEEVDPHGSNAAGKPSITQAAAWAIRMLFSTQRNPLRLSVLTFIAIAVVGPWGLLFDLGSYGYFGPEDFLRFGIVASPFVYVLASLFLRPAIRLASANQASWRDLHSGAHKWSYVAGLLILIVVPLAMVPGIVYGSAAISDRFFPADIDVKWLLALVAAAVIPPLIFPLYYWIACCLVSGDYSIKQSLTYGLVMVKKYYLQTLVIFILLEIATVVSCGLSTFFLAPIFTLSMAHFFHQMRRKEGMLPAQPPEDNLSGHPVKEEAPHGPTREPNLRKAITHAFNLIFGNTKNIVLLFALSFITVTVVLVIGVFEFGSTVLIDPFLISLIGFIAPPLLYVIASLFLRPAIRLASANQASWRDLHSGTHKWSILLGILVLIVVPLVIVPSFIYFLANNWDPNSILAYDPNSGLAVIFYGGALIPPLIFPLYYWVGCALVSGDYPIKQSLKYGLKFGVKYYLITLVLIIALEFFTVISFGAPAFFLASIFTLTMAHLFNQMREIEGLLPALQAPSAG